MVKKQKENTDKQGGFQTGSKYHHILKSLPSVQKEVYHLLIDEGLTIRQVSIRRQTTVRAVNKIKTKLIIKGLIKGSSYRGFQNGADCKCRGVPNYNLHGQRFTIGVISFTTGNSEHKYFNKISNKGISYRGQTIKLRSKVIEVYSRRHFKGHSENDCLEQSSSYWNYYFEALQTKYGVVLLKPGYENVKETYAEVALMRNGLAYRQNKLKDRIFYYDKGKLWLKTDMSFRGDDLEFIGKKSTTGLGDAGLFEKHLKCWRDPNTPTPTQSYELLTGLMKVVNTHINPKTYSSTEKIKYDKHIIDYIG